MPLRLLLPQYFSILMTQFQANLKAHREMVADDDGFLTDSPLNLRPSSPNKMWQEKHYFEICTEESLFFFAQRNLIRQPQLAMGSLHGLFGLVCLF